MQEMILVSFGIRYKTLQSVPLSINFGRKDGNIYLMKHPTLIIYSYMALNIVKDYYDNKRGNLLLPLHGLLHAPSHSTYHNLCYTSCEPLVGIRNS